MKFAPTSLAGQLTLLLLIALAIAQGVAVTLFARERIEAARRAYRDNAVLRTETVMRLLDGTPPENFMTPSLRRQARNSCGSR